MSFVVVVTFYVMKVYQIRKEEGEKEGRRTAGFTIRLYVDLFTMLLVYMDVIKS